jgi:hypothetical protein
MRLRTSQTIKWHEVTEQRYNEMLGILPPIFGGLGFQVGEPAAHTDEGIPTFAPFVQIGTRHFEGDGAMTRREFKLVTAESVLLNVQEKKELGTS